MPLILLLLVVDVRGPFRLAVGRVRSQPHATKVVVRSDCAGLGRGVPPAPLTAGRPRAAWCSGID